MKTFDLTIFNTAEGRLRLLSAVVLAPVFIGVVYLGGASYAGLVALMVSVAALEWMKLVDADTPIEDRCGLIAAIVLAVFLAAADMVNMGLITIAMATVALYAHRSNHVDSNRALWFAAGLPYMGLSGIALVYLRNLPMGFAATLYLLAIVWGMDIGAYVVGRLVGGAKLAPVISPNKTWSGFFGGMVLGGLCAMVVLLLNHQNVIAGLLFAFLLGAVAQGGDLFKSFFKRRAGVKDCGNIIPGHGGVLDRIDGLVFAAIALALFEAVFHHPIAG